MTLTPLTDAWVERVAAVARRHFAGADLNGAGLAHAVREVSQRYTRERSGLAAGRVLVADLVARLKWFSIRDLAKIEVPLMELSARAALPQSKTWRVLDVGAGVGTSSLGVARVARRVGVEAITVHALDRDADALRVFELLAADVTALDAAPIDLRTTVTDLTRAPHLPDVLPARDNGQFDLIVVGFVINELWPDDTDEQRVEHARQWLQALSRKLTADGVLVVLEPALREQTRQLQRVRDALAASNEAPFVFAPCLRSGPCPMLDNDRDWCHAQVPFRLPQQAADIARMAGLRDHDLTFSYLTLRMQPGHAGQRTNTAPDANAVQRVVSALLPSKGKVELIACGEAGLHRVMRLDRHRSPDNAQLTELGRGSVVRLPLVGDDGRIRVGTDDLVASDWHW